MGCGRNSKPQFSSCKMNVRNGLIIQEQEYTSDQLPSVFPLDCFHKFFLIWCLVISINSFPAFPGSLPWLHFQNKKEKTNRSLSTDAAVWNFSWVENTSGSNVCFESLIQARSGESKQCIELLIYGGNSYD